MINLIISAILQVIIFSLIPFIVYAVRNRKVSGFLSYIGLTKSNTKANILGFLISMILGGPVILLAIVNPGFNEILMDPSSATGRIHTLGFTGQAVTIILVTAIIKTAFSEEIFFRGFVAKRLIAITNYQTGNLIQSIIFGSIHTLLFISITGNILFLIVIFLFPAIGAYLKTYVNEKLANGSIIPGWIAHASGNVMAYSIVGFLL